MWPPPQCTANAAVGATDPKRGPFTHTGHAQYSQPEECTLLPMNANLSYLHAKRLVACRADHSGAPAVSITTRSSQGFAPPSVRHPGGLDQGLPGIALDGGQAIPYEG